jgi:adenine-specific DNA-methyltransferase
VTPYEQDGITLHCGDCREVLATLPDGSVDLIVTDPPYFKVKDDWWDRQWDKPEEFAAWMGTLCDQWQRVLKPNGSLYVFASPQMAWHVEGEVRKRFNVLNAIQWRKVSSAILDKGGPWQRQCKEELRAYFPQTETIIFAEHFGADNIAKGEAGYGAKCDELRGFVFEPLRAYFEHELFASGYTLQQVEAALSVSTTGRKTGANHWFSKVQYQLPTKSCYQWLRELLNANGGDHLRREYEDLRREYEDLRRPFYASESRPYTDVWDFQTVGAYEGKHPCEKPLAMMEHIIQTSSRPGAVVLDCFAGSGVVGEAVRNIGEGRQAILCEIAEKWCNVIRERLRQRVLF